MLWIKVSWARGGAGFCHFTDQYAIPLFIHLLDWDELQRRGVHAITQASWRRTIVEYVPQMRVCVAAADFGAGKSGTQNNY